MTGVSAALHTGTVGFGAAADDPHAPPPGGGTTVEGGTGAAPGTELGGDGSGAATGPRSGSPSPTGEAPVGVGGAGVDPASSAAGL
ncbi:MAG TPA: hypothetical protein VK215_04355 [Acidimicrobiales bacterium]|nr:hypothetical protein [Acidimicrobiales bacterium]